MIAWLIAVTAGVLAAALQYAGVRGRGLAVPLVMRAVAVAGIVALLLNAPTGRAAPVRPLVALDASASWTRWDAARWRSAVETADSIRQRDTLYLTGDSARPVGRAPGVPVDGGSRVGPAVDRALAGGRPLVLVTDGELDDADVLRGLPAGSRVVVPSGQPLPDVAVANLELPRAIVAGDTIEARVTLVAGAAGAPPSELTVRVGDMVLGTARVDSLGALAERTITVRGSVRGRDGPALAIAAVRAAGDGVAPNDTVAIAVDISPTPGAVFVSTAPDYDARYALAVLRGSLSIPTRGFYRVATGAWRADATLAAVAESDVRAAIAAAPLVVLHGDTAVFGPPRRIARGPLALVVPVHGDRGEWYVSGAPASPLASVLSGLPWDSLPPISVGDAPAGDWRALEARLSRSGVPRAVVSGSDAPRRVAIVSASGLWRWRFRGGVAADAFTALWGGIFDWLAEQRADRRPALPEHQVVRAGEPIVWRRGSADTVVAVTLRRRAGRGSGASGVDSLTLRFSGGATMVESGPLAPGIYDVATSGGPALLAVNASRELLPRRPTVTAGATGGGAAAGAVPRVRDTGWPFAVVILLLCAEWLLRRRAGLR